MTYYLKHLVNLYLSYMKAAFWAILLGGLFFFLYAGIKTNHIPLNFVAGVFSALVVGLIASVAFYYGVKKRVGELISIREEAAKAIEASFGVVGLAFTLLGLIPSFIGSVMVILLKEFVTGISSNTKRH